MFETFLFINGVIYKTNIKELHSKIMKRLVCAQTQSL